jgi:hypothetical protein
MFYFERLGPTSFRASEHVGGVWNPSEQHIAPALGLLAHAIELEHASRREDRLRLARISYDILGTLPISVVEIDIALLRPGRTIELVEARLSHNGQVAVIARGWFLQAADTTDLSGSALPMIPPPQAIESWNANEVWPGGFVRSVEARRSLLDRGRAVSWVRTAAELVAGEPASPTAAALGIVDIANGLAPLAGMGEASFPNVDLTAHLFAEPKGDWLGFDTMASFGQNGVGLTHSTLHDEKGPIGTVSQSLTIRR